MAAALRLTLAHYSEAAFSVWFWFRSKVVRNPNKQARADYPNDLKSKAALKLQ